MSGTDTEQIIMASQPEATDDELILPISSQGSPKTDSSSDQSADVPLGGASGKTKCYVFLVASVAAIGGVLFGYDVGIVSGALLPLARDFNLGCWEKEMVVSSMTIGALVASLVGGFIVDRFGRRVTIMLTSLVFVVGALVLGFTPNYPVLIVGRLVVGFAVSMSAIGGCIYISEISPPKRRGFLVSLNELAITIGFLFAYLINFAFIQMPNGWRYMFGLSAIPAVIQGFLMFFLPDSPRYLMIKDKEIKAKAVLFKMQGPEGLDDHINNIRTSLSNEKSHGIRDLFSSVENMRGRMFVGMGLSFLQQFTGQPNVLYYAPTIFQSLGFKSDQAATLATVGLGVVKVCSTVIALFCLDKAGRRKMLLLGTCLMTVGIVGLGGTAFTFNDRPAHPCSQSSDNISLTLLSSSTKSVLLKHGGKDLWRGQLNETIHPKLGVEGYLANTTNPTEDFTPSNSTSADGKWISLGSLMIYVAAYAISFGPVTWLVLSEIFPPYIKGRAMSTATVVNWATNLIVSMSFLNVMSALGVPVTFLSFGGICALSVVFVFFFVPETKGRTLEQITAELSDTSLTDRWKNNCKELSGCCGRNDSHANVQYRPLSNQ